MQVFVPLEEIPEGVMLPAMLVPYQVGMRLAGRAPRLFEARAATSSAERAQREYEEAPGELLCCED